MRTKSSHLESMFPDDTIVVEWTDWGLGEVIGIKYDKQREYLSPDNNNRVPDKKGPVLIIGGN
jgi:hypothetical protein